jgi:hypothetical protein
VSASNISRIFRRTLSDRRRLGRSLRNPASPNRGIEGEVPHRAAATL